MVCVRAFISARWLLWLFHKLVPRQLRSYEHSGYACATKEEFDERVEDSDTGLCRSKACASDPVGRFGRSAHCR